MGSCLSLNCVNCDMFLGSSFHERKGYQSNMKSDLDGITFSHYSLTSETSFLDLYPTLKFMENDQSSNSAMSGSCCVDYDHWRHSGLPLIDDDSVEGDYPSAFVCEHKSIVDTSQSLNHPELRLPQSNTDQHLSEMQNSKGNGPNTSSIMSADNELSKVTLGVTKKIKTPINEVPTIDTFGGNKEYSDVLKDNFSSDLVASMAIDKRIEDRMQLNPAMNNDSSFGYTNLDDECDDRNGKSPISSRFAFNNRLRMRRSLTPNPKNTENKRLNMFRRRNTIQDQLGDEKG